MSDSGHAPLPNHTQHEPPRVIIRPANADDDATVFRLNMELAAAVAPELDRERLLRLTCDLLDTVPEGANLTYLAEEEGVAVGLARGILTPQPPHRRVYPGRAGYVDEIYVIPDHRKRGISSKLLHALLSGFRSQGVTYIYTHPATRLSAALCSSQGASKIETYHISWPRDLPALISPV